VGTNLNAKEKENANSYGNLIEIRERAKSLGSTVRKKIEKADTMIYILNTIATAKEREINKVFKIIIKRIKNDNPRILLIHCLNNFPKRIKGIKLKKMKIKGTISVYNNALIVYIIENTSFARGSKLCKNDFFFMNLKALRNSKDIFMYSS
jgi:hypothetical protein